jgi:hypothetical protein
MTAKEIKKAQKAIVARVETRLAGLHNMSDKQKNLELMHTIEDLKKYRNTLLENLTI